MARMEAGGFVGRLRRTVATAAAILVLPIGTVAAQTPEQVQRLAEQAIRRLGLQTDFPVVPEPPSFSIPFPRELLWIVIITAIAIMLYAFRDLIPILRSSRDTGWTSEEGGLGGDRAGSSAAALGAADQLAAEGRFVEAMHILLLQGLAAIREGLDEQLSDSLTSREILRSTRLSDTGRSSLQDIVSRVELTYFGQRPAARDDYFACRTSFNALALALHGSAPA